MPTREARMTIRQVVMPHVEEAPVEAELADLELRGMHPLVPGLEGAGVMLAVEVPGLGLESRSLHPRLPHGRRRQHAAGEDVALDEIHGMPVACEGRIVDGDDLQRPTTARLQAVMHRLEELAPVALPHRLEHLDGDDAVELAAEVAVVRELELHLPIQARRLGPGAGFLELLLREGDARDPAARLLGGV